ARPRPLLRQRRGATKPISPLDAPMRSSNPQPTQWLGHRRAARAGGDPAGQRRGLLRAKRGWVTRNASTRSEFGRIGRGYDAICADRVIARLLVWRSRRLRHVEPLTL